MVDLFDDIRITEVFILTPEPVAEIIRFIIHYSYSISINLETTAYPHYSRTIPCSRDLYIINPTAYVVTKYI